MDTETRRRILNEAETWLGTPYIWKAGVKGVGVDCGKLLYEVYGKFFQLPPYPNDYPEDWALHREDERYLDFIMPFVTPCQKPIFGGIAVFQFGRNFSHGAIVTEDKQFIHSYGRTGAGCVRKSPRTFFCLPGGKPRPAKFFDLKGL